MVDNSSLTVPPGAVSLNWEIKPIPCLWYQEVSLPSAEFAEFLAYDEDFLLVNKNTVEFRPDSEVLAKDIVNVLKSKLDLFRSNYSGELVNLVKTSNSWMFLHSGESLVKCYDFRPEYGTAKIHIFIPTLEKGFDEDNYFINRLDDGDYLFMQETDLDSFEDILEEQVFHAIARTGRVFPVS
jgi:hypothetical protein